MSFDVEEVDELGDVDGIGEVDEDDKVDEVGEVVKVGAKPLTWFVTLEDISVHLPLL